MAQAATHTRTFANMVSITPVSIRRPSLRLFPPPSWSSSESSGKFNWLALCRPRPSLLRAIQCQGGDDGGGLVSGQ